MENEQHVLGGHFAKMEEGNHSLSVYGDLEGPDFEGLGGIDQMMREGHEYPVEETSGGGYGIYGGDL
ncbi:MAG: hypothetical protein C4584_01170 [Armatimonadetes bacterium]|nr:MAG: hypothetical protein C4584_01170 [Armatimonadota bacterium]